MKKTALIFTGVLLLLLAATLWAATKVLDIAVHPEDNHTRDYEYWFERVYNKYPELEQWYDSLSSHQLMRDTFLLANDGLKRHAIILQHDSLATGATVVVHGYKDDCIDMMRYYYLHYEVLHRNVIVPELQAHGRSEGEDVRFGWLDRLDCSQIWLPMAHELWPGLDIVQHGLSMGGATTMMTSGEEFADTLRVRGFIDDCGYSDTYSLFTYQLRQEYNLPAFPILNAADWICSLRYGWRPSEASALTQLAKCELPVLFIHGDADDYVPTEMVYRCYEAKQQGYRELWVVPGAAHAASIHKYWDDYCQHVRTFIDNHCSQ